MNYYRIHVSENDGHRIDGSDQLYELCRSGMPFDWNNSFELQTSAKGKLYDWIGGYSWWPFVTKKVKSRIENQTSGAIQWQGPFVIVQQEYFLLNCVKIIDCAKKGSNDNKLFLDKEKLKNVSIFRPFGFLKDPICSSDFRDLCVKYGHSGIRFGLIKDDGWEDFPF